MYRLWLGISVVAALFFAACDNGADAANSGATNGRILKDSRDGQTYRTVTIGTQIWMAQNLNYETADSYCYEDDPANCVKYGRLYIWEAALNACPSGWHLPSKEEFEELIEAVGGINVAGKKLKSTNDWLCRDEYNHCYEATDAFGFSALPAGDRNKKGSFDYAGYDTHFWSATERNSDESYYMHFRRADTAEEADLGNDEKLYAYSVRCVKDYFR